MLPLAGKPAHRSRPVSSHVRPQRTRTVPLSDFIRAAKLATYAAQGDDATVRPLLPGSKQLEHRDGDHLYRDIYFGMLRFVGQEVVYAKEAPCWSMAYSGAIESTVARDDARALYAFLRRALLLAPQELPVRGPSSYVEGQFRYTCLTRGSLAWFQGEEVIMLGGQPAYALRFSGGSLG